MKIIFFLFFSIFLFSAEVEDSSVEGDDDENTDTTLEIKEYSLNPKTTFKNSKNDFIIDLDNTGDNNATNVKVTFINDFELDLTTPDELNVIRNWTIEKDDLIHLLNDILSMKLEVVFIQFNYGFFDFKKLDIFISKLVDCGIKVHITFHSTVDAIKNKRKTQFFVQEQGCLEI